MGERRVLTDDAPMVSIAELSDAARHSEMASPGCELVGVEQTVVCGLDADSRTEPIGFAASLARRLGWRLTLVPLPEAATQDERLGRLLAASTREQAGFVVTQAVGRGASAAALVDQWRGAACPLIAVPPGTPALGTGPVFCCIGSNGSSGAAARAASRLANAIGARLRLVHVVSHAQPPESAALLAVGAPGGDAASPDGVVAAVLRDSRVPVMVVPGGAPVTRASSTGRGPVRSWR